nr:MAG TPA: hypothetical protein [Caudoviricetes sp.]
MFSPKGGGQVDYPILLCPPLLPVLLTLYWSCLC